MFDTFCHIVADPTLENPALANVITHCDKKIGFSKIIVKKVFLLVQNFIIAVKTKGS